MRNAPYRSVFLVVVVVILVVELVVVSFVKGVSAMGMAKQSNSCSSWAIFLSGRQHVPASMGHF